MLRLTPSRNRGSIKCRSPWDITDFQVKTRTLVAAKGALRRGTPNHKYKIQHRQPIKDKQSTDLRTIRLPPSDRLFYPKGTNNWLLFDKPGSGTCWWEDKRTINPKLLRYRRRLGYNTKMRSYVQFITTPTADTPGTSLLLHFDNRRYLIGNVAEGTQRACVQRKLGLTKVENIFLTGKTEWANTGGLLGLILTLADSTAASSAETKKKQDDLASKAAAMNQSDYRKAVKTVTDRHVLNIHGSRNLTHMLGTARRFVFRKGMPLYANEFREGAVRGSDEPDWKDENVKVWAIAIDPEEPMKSPRKRSHEEFSDEEGKSNSAVVSSSEEEDRKDQIRRAVVSEMFDSEWRLDALISTKLSEVKLPATMFLRSQEGKLNRYEGPMPGDKNFEDINVLVRNPWPGALIESLPATKPSKTAVSYIMKNHPQRGKFNPAEAKRLGVTPGKDFSKLTRGESVTTAAGNTVTPEQVLGEGKSGSGFAVFDLPDRGYIDPILRRKEWHSKEIMKGIEAVIWILGPGVAADQRLQGFMREQKQYKHVVTSPDTCANSLALESPASAAIRLHLVDSDRFPVPVHSNVAPQIESEGPTPFSVARAGIVYQLEPAFEKQEQFQIAHLDTAQVIKDMPEEVLQLAEKARAEINKPEYLAELEEKQKDIPSKDAEVITLGTGSALPSKYRNVSATLLRVPGAGNYLLDCGENTLGQLKRVFGAELPSILRDLKAIWISHLHADHHLGTASVIKAWHTETRKDPLTASNSLVVSSDAAMLKWLQEYSEVEDYGHSRIHPVILNFENFYSHEFSAKEREAWGMTSVKAKRVNHCHGALAVCISFTTKFKVAYSGDCRPCPAFAELGKGATLLIHEATFDDELIGDAIAKKHSTTSEALDIGRQMCARRIVLTHFSQRYQKIPVMNTGDDIKCVVAFDYMRCKVGDIAKLEHFRAALLKLYEEENDKEKDE
jgi:ribonuclease Z